MSIVIVRSGKNIRVIAGTITLCSVFCVSSQVLAADSRQDTWRHCSSTFAPPSDSPRFEQFQLQRKASNSLMPLMSGEAVDTEISGHHLEVEQNNKVYVKGKVEIQRGDTMIEATEATYYQDTDQALIKGPMRLSTDKQLLISESARLNLNAGTGELISPDFWLVSEHLRGHADSVGLEDGEVMRLEGAMITSCEPGKEHWQMLASELVLDQANNEGTAKHARIFFFDVPIFYFPYLSFPLEGRKTGFLVPNGGSNRQSGAYFSVPYYLNLAPNRDATITPTHYNDRGLQVAAEVRYLNRSSQGEVLLEHLADDDVTGEDRSYGSVEHTGYPADGWRLDLKAQKVSDEEYLDDFSSTLGSSSLTHLESYVALDYQMPDWWLAMRYQTFQSLDNTVAPEDEPYKRSPQIRLDSQPLYLGKGFQFRWQSELVRFERNQGVVGERVDMKPTMAWPKYYRAGYFKPELSLQHTHYHLNHQFTGDNDQRTRTLPITSMDTGLVFERDMDWWGLADKGYIQTLEPRLFLLHVPFKEQDDLIRVDTNGDGLPESVVFDTGRPSFSFDQLFRDNRFIGVDRVGDARQATLAVASRILDRQGRETFAATVGQIFYFADQRVSLPGGAVQTDTASDIAAQLRSRLGDAINAQADLLWDNSENELAQGSLRVRYKIDEEKITNLDYRFLRDEIKQADVSVLWRVHWRWKALARYHYSLLEDKTLETMLGVEYESCCWRMRLVGREYIKDFETGERNDSLWVQLELKGLASVGQKIESLFDDGILD